MTVLSINSYEYPKESSCFVLTLLNIFQRLKILVPVTMIVRSKIVIRNILALTKVKNGLSNYFAETIVYHCYYIYHMKILSHIIIWHLYKGVIRMFYEFCESLLLSLEYTIFISAIFQSFIRYYKPRNVSIFNLMLF